MEDAPKKSASSIYRIKRSAFYMSMNIGEPNEMFLIDPDKTWYESIAEAWGWIAAFFLALTAIWRATRKTATKGFGFFTVIKRFIDTSAALNQLTETVKNGFDDVKAEQAYLNAKLEVLSDGHVTPSFRADELGNFIDVNEAFCQLFHKSLDEIEGDGWTSIFARDDRAESLASWDRAIVRKTNFAQNFRVKVHGGEFKTVKMRARPIFDGKGEFKEFIGSISLLEGEEANGREGKYISRGRNENSES